MIKKKNENLRHCIGGDSCVELDVHVTDMAKIVDWSSEIRIRSEGLVCSYVDYFSYHLLKW